MRNQLIFLSLFLCSTFTCIAQSNTPPKSGQHFFEGAVHGTILESPRGTFGFGYDPVFIPMGGERSFAEMDKEAKNQWSHRSIALSNFIQWFKNQQ